MKGLRFILSFTVATLLMAGGIAVVADMQAVEVTAQTALVSSFVINSVASVLFYIVAPALPAGIAANYVGVGPSPKGGQSVQVINTERERADYTIHSTDPRFNSQSGNRLIPDVLRMEALFTANNNKLKFFTYIGDPLTVTETERRLDRNDAFVATSWRIGLMVKTPGKNNGQVITYPNIFQLGAAAAADMWNFYNGVLRMNVDNKDEVKTFPLIKFLDIPTTQQTAATNYDSRTGASGVIPCIPNIIIDGDKKNEIEVEFPIHAAWAGATPKTGGDLHYAVFELFGYKALNASKGS